MADCARLTIRLMPSASPPTTVRPMTASDLSACINILLGYPWTRYAMTAFIDWWQENQTPA